ncbi:FMN-dependent NADH-azoreductase AzoR1 [Zobellella aerophila]|uniref:FMN dependent NADH:quinone oxidoreductase n=2 Tax=Zobellella aerophila TaxID=870480 RepID=A0ABP6VWQ8_9GAMM
MTERFIRLWRHKHPSGNILYRELGNQPVPHITEQWINAAFTPGEARSQAERDVLALSDELVKELQDATTILIGCPMHNLSIPSTLKAYIDQVVRMGLTTTLVPDRPHSPYVGLLENKKAYIMLVRGGYGYDKGGCYSQMNFQEPYLAAVLNMMGITQVETVTLEYAASNDGRFDCSLERAKARIDAVLGGPAHKK